MKLLDLAVFAVCDQIEDLPRDQILLLFSLSDDIQLMWADDYRHDRDVWNIEL